MKLTAYELEVTVELPLPVTKRRLTITDKELDELIELVRDASVGATEYGWGTHEEIAKWTTRLEKLRG